ncbi:hypothetical protein LPJ56_003877, partial [Coemansia sp. RSA 2599]
MTQIGQQRPPHTPLPPGYIAEFDGRYGRYYYVNTATGVSQWEPPQVDMARGGSGGGGGPSQSMFGSNASFQQQP